MDPDLCPDCPAVLKGAQIIKGIAYSCFGCVLLTQTEFPKFASDNSNWLTHSEAPGAFSESQVFDP